VATYKFNAYYLWLGIPPDEQPADHYRALGVVRFESDAKVIREAAERQIAHVRRYQIGKHGEQATKILRELSTAKACLSDVASKTEYDRQLRFDAGSASGPSQFHPVRGKIATEVNASGASQQTEQQKSEAVAIATADVVPNPMAPVRLPSVRQDAARSAPRVANKSRPPRRNKRSAGFLPLVERTDQLLGRVSSQHGGPLHNAMRGILWTAPLLILIATVASLVTPGPNPPEPTPTPLSPAEPALAIGDIQDLQVGPDQPVVILPILENADSWSGKVRFEIDQPPSGIELDPRSGRIEFRSAEPGRYAIKLRVVSLTSDQTAASSFAITVTTPDDAVESEVPTDPVANDGVVDPTMPADIPPPAEISAASELFARDNIPPYELAMAGGGDPAEAPAELVGILGSSRLRHWGSVKGVAFSPDGLRIASGSADHTVRLWDPATGEQTAVLSGHSDDVQAVAFSPNGRLLASASDDDTVHIWDVARRRLKKTLFGHEADVKAVVFLPTGEHLVSAGNDKKVRVWQVADGTQINAMSGHTSSISSLAVSPDDVTVASGGYDRTVRLWNWLTGLPLQNMEGHESHIHGLKFVRNGTLLASVACTSDPTIKLWNKAGGDAVETLEGHDGGILSVAYDSNQDVLATTSYDGHAKLWSLESKKELSTLHIHASADSVCFSPDGQTLAMGMQYGAIRLADSAKLRDMTGHDGAMRAITFTPDGTSIVSTSWDRTVRQWSLSDEADARIVGQHGSKLNCMAMSPDGKLVAAGSADKAGVIRIWKLADGQELHTLKGHTASVSSLAFGPDGETLATGSNDKSVRLWNVPDGTERKVLSEHPQAVATVKFSPDGSSLVAGCNDGTMVFWNADSGEKENEIKAHEKAVFALAFHPRGKHIASGSIDQTIKIWDAASGSELRTLAAHTEMVNCVQFNPDGSQLASCSDDGTVRLWNPVTGESTRTIQLASPKGVVQSLAYSPDGAHLATANGNGTIYLLKVPTSNDVDQPPTPARGAN
jgi:WD40 repeat protein